MNTSTIYNRLDRVLRRWERRHDVEYRDGAGTLVRDFVQHGTMVLSHGSSVVDLRQGEERLDRVLERISSRSWRDADGRTQVTPRVVRDVRRETCPLDPIC